MDIDHLRQAMNELGASSVPFLWGVDYELSKGFLIQKPLETTSLLWNIKGVGNDSALRNTGRKINLREETPPEPEYREKFATVRQGLMRGDSFLANLTVASRVTPDCTLEEIYASVKAPYKLLIPGQFLCFSPESFVRIQSGHISTYPMKGTIDASVPDAADRLIGDYKELCEHFTIVDLMRNDLNSVAADVKVSRFRYIDRIETHNGAILQTSSEIIGRLSPEKAHSFGDIILPLLPAGSICGAPKPATLRLISQAESQKRGWYTGVFGYFDGNTMDSAVMIRCIQRAHDNNLYFHSGGGITVNSVCEEEYNEITSKIYLPQNT